MKHKWKVKIPALFWISSRKKHKSQTAEAVENKDSTVRKKPAHLLIKEK